MNSIDENIPPNGLLIGDAENWTAAWQSLYPNHSKAIYIPSVDVNGEAQVQVQNCLDQTRNNLSGSSAFDFTMPCPKYCDKNSSLYHS